MAVMQHCMLCSNLYKAVIASHVLQLVSWGSSVLDGAPTCSHLCWQAQAADVLLMLCRAACTAACHAACQGAALMAWTEASGLS